jgi:hypothetical protein
MSAILYILWPFGNMVEIWYIFPCFGIFYQQKSGNHGAEAIFLQTAPTFFRRICLAKKKLGNFLIRLATATKLPDGIFHEPKVRIWVYFRGP